MKGGSDLEGRRVKEKSQQEAGGVLLGLGWSKGPQEWSGEARK